MRREHEIIVIPVTAGVRQGNTIAAVHGDLPRPDGFIKNTRDQRAGDLSAGITPLAQPDCQQVYHVVPDCATAASVRSNLLMDVGERATRVRFLIRDRDSKFTSAFDQVLAGNGTRIITTPTRSPQANSFAERYVGTLRRECLDHLLIYGEQHLRQTVTEYARHYNEHRPHQSREQRPPLHNPGEAIDVTARIDHRQVVHGLINEYRRAA
jgi:transposase InsO family protein